MIMMDEKIMHFLTHLSLRIQLPKGVEVMQVYEDPQVRRIAGTFYQRYYHDDNPRQMLIGINPGRYGGGVTGIPFTDPVSLEQYCGIANPWKKQKELSSVFMYAMIQAYGGAEKFYKKFYVTAVSPLGFLKNGKNLNYYDDAQLLQRIQPFAVRTLRQQLDFGMKRNSCICIGEGDNYRFLQHLNEKHYFFDQIIALPHPRYIMQYRRKTMSDYIDRYLKVLNAT